MLFVTSKDNPDLFIAVTSREDIRAAVDSCLRSVYGRPGRRVCVYMNCQLSGPTIDAVVEVAQA